MVVYGISVGLFAVKMHVVLGFSLEVRNVPYNHYYARRMRLSIAGQCNAACVFKENLITRPFSVTILENIQIPQRSRGRR